MNADAQGAVARSSLADEAYSAIRGWILAGRIPPGERLTVRPIADELGLSPTPINVALVALARDGVLESRLHRGFFVPELSLNDMREIYEMREGLDSVAVRRAADAAEHGAIAAELATYCDRQHERLAACDLAGYRNEDLAFHQAVWRLSGNERLRRAGENLQDQMRLGNAISSRRPGRGDQSVDEHRAVVAAIAAGDADAAERAAREHIRLTARMFAEELEEHAEGARGRGEKRAAAAER